GERERPEFFSSKENPPVAHAPGSPEWRELLAALDAELHRLPDRLRAPLLLCYYDGCTQDEAARRLGWSVGTLRRRLDQGRDLLRVRLTARGATLGAGLLATVLATRGAPAAAVLRHGAPVFRHGDEIINVLVTPDDKSILTQGHRAVRLWDAVTGQEQGALELPDDGPDFWTASLTPDGKTLITTRHNGTA